MLRRKFCKISLYLPYFKDFTVGMPLLARFIDVSSLHTTPDTVSFYFQYFVQC